MNFSFCNRNAYKDGRWDAKRNLGNQNQYNSGSRSWRLYEYAYTKFTQGVAAAVALHGG